MINEIVNRGKKMEDYSANLDASEKEVLPKGKESLTEQTQTSAHVPDASAPLNRNVSAASPEPTAKKGKFCTNCGSEIDSRAEICPKCGVRQPGSMGFAGDKSPAIAALLSFLVVGLGQVYAGKMKRGIVLFAACVVFFMVSFLVLPVFAALACWIVSIYDAYKLAQGEPGPFSFIDNYTNET